MADFGYRSVMIIHIFYRDHSNHCVGNRLWGARAKVGTSVGKLLQSPRWKMMGSD